MLCGPNLSGEHEEEPIEQQQVEIGHFLQMAAGREWITAGCGVEDGHELSSSTPAHIWGPGLHVALQGTALGKVPTRLLVTGSDQDLGQEKV